MNYLQGERYSSNSLVYYFWPTKDLHCFHIGKQNSSLLANTSLPFALQFSRPKWLLGIWPRHCSQGVAILLIWLCISPLFQAWGSALSLGQGAPPYCSQAVVMQLRSLWPAVTLWLTQCLTDGTGFETSQF